MCTCVYARARMYVCVINIFSFRSMKVADSRQARPLGVSVVDNACSVGVRLAQYFKSRLPILCSSFWLTLICVG